MRPRLLDLFCGGGGASEGYRLAGFDVVGVDHLPQRHYRGGAFVQADALDFVRAHGHEFDAIHASPPCQAYSSLRSLQPTKEYPDLIPATREALIATGKPHVIENVPGAPLGGGDTYLLMLCGTMFGLATPDGRAEIWRHRLFETNWFFGLRPACQHGGATRQENGRRLILCAVGDNPHSPALRHAARRRREALSVTGNSTHGASYTRARRARRAMTVTGNTAQTNRERNVVRETFSVADARAAMGNDWMTMKSLSQSIPKAYAEWIGQRLLAALREGA